MSTPHPAVQQLTNSNPLTPAISSRWGFREKVLDSSPIESYDAPYNFRRITLLHSVGCVFNPHFRSENPHHGRIFLVLYLPFS